MLRACVLRECIVGREITGQLEIYNDNCRNMYDCRWLMERIRLERAPTRNGEPKGRIGAELAKLNRAYEDDGSRPTREDNAY